MNNFIKLITIMSFCFLIGFTGYITILGKGVKTPKIVKKSARVGSVRSHHYIHGGYRYGK